METYRVRVRMRVSVGMAPAGFRRRARTVLGGSFEKARFSAAGYLKRAAGAFIKRIGVISSAACKSTWRM